MHEQKPYLHALNLTGVIGPKGFDKLAKFFAGDFSAAWRSSQTELAATGLAQETITKIYKTRLNLNPSAEYENLIKTIGEPIILNEQSYPKLLSETPYAPYLLYCRGKLKTKNPIAVVGTRKPTSYGTTACHKLTSVLAQNSATIVSGLALGIDGIAHEAALKAGGKTIAVLGSGIDDGSIYPSSHKKLAQKIIQNGGAVISEFSPQTPGLKHHFPQRNRIIAGLSLGTLVVEAKKQSGALITARYALDYNRDVFALPGSIFSATAEGPHALIREGAMLVASGEEILEHYGIKSEGVLHATAEKTLNELEIKILAILESAAQFDELVSAVAVPAHILNSALTMLELKNFIKNIGNRTYIRLL